MALDPGFKGGQGWSCGNSIREAIPLRDSAGEDGLMSTMGSVEQHVKGAGLTCSLGLGHETWIFLFVLFFAPLTLV